MQGCSARLLERVEQAVGAGPAQPVAPSDPAAASS